MRAAVDQLGQLSHLMLLPLERIWVTFSLNNINPCSVWKKPLLLDKGNPFSLGRCLWTSTFSDIFREAAEDASSARVRRKLVDKAPALFCFAIHWDQSSSLNSNVSLLKAEVLGWYLMKGTVIESLLKSALEEKIPWCAKSCGQNRCLDWKVKYWHAKK